LVTAISLAVSYLQAAAAIIVAIVVTTADTITAS